jgi:hypothetical protein
VAGEDSLPRATDGDGESEEPGGELNDEDDAGLCKFAIFQKLRYANVVIV